MTSIPGLWPIPRKALALGIAIGLFIVGFAAKVVVDLRDETLRAALRSGNDVATSIAYDIERSIESYDLSLKSVVADLQTAGVMELPVEVRDRVLFDSSAKAKYLGPILVLDAHGTTYIDSGSRVPRRDSFVNADFFAFHRTHRDRRLSVGHPYQDAEGAWRITVSRRLDLEDGEFAGVVVGTIDLAYFEELFAKIDLGRDSAMSLALADGTMLMRVPRLANDIGRDLSATEVFRWMARRGDGSLRANSSVDHVERQYLYRRVGDVPLFLTVGQSTDEIYTGWRTRAALIGLLTVLLLSGCAALAVILQRELRRRVEAEAALFAQGERLQVTLQSIGDGVLSTDEHGDVLYMNAIAEQMTGWSAADARGRPLHDVLHLTGSTASIGLSGLEPLESALTGLATEVVLHRKGGGQFVIEENVAPIRGRDGEVTGAVTVFRDVSEARAMAHRMSHLAQHDALTDLPNRMLFHERLARAIERARRAHQKVAVLFLDLDRFKNVNDSLGHRVGDQLLVEVANRLTGCVRESDTVSRQGGDEFVVLVSDLKDGQGCQRVAEEMLRALARPFVIEGRPLTITTSIGVSVYPDDGTDIVELTKNADAAMYLAKQSGRNVCRFFTNQLGDLAQRRLNFEQRIDEGLRNDEFVLHYQPICRSSDGLPIGAEALVRWVQQGNVVPPGEFIPLAEECGRIVQLGDRILTMACRQSVAWNAGRSVPFPVSVNVSAHQFRSAGFVERVGQTLRDTGLDPRCLELEITESVLLDEADRTETVLRDLRGLGVSIALDDFGTGYSSLSYLSRFPVDRIKIDRSFIQRIVADERTASIVRGIIGLGRDLGLSIIAEGVETLDQRRALTSMGCPGLQGYLFGRPSATFDGGLGELRPGAPSNGPVDLTPITPPLLSGEGRFG